MARNVESGKLILGYAQKFSSQSSLVEPSTELITVADLVISTVPGDSFAELWADVGASSSSSTGLLLDAAYNPWPSSAASSWGGVSVSGLEMLIWQAVEQVRLFAHSQNESNAFQATEVYEVMKKPVSGITDH
jgi:shikimate dehydrogenase